MVSVKVHFNIRALKCDQLLRYINGELHVCLGNNLQYSWCNQNGSQSQWFRNQINMRVFKNGYLAFSHPSVQLYIMVKCAAPFRQKEVVKSDAPSPLLTFKRSSTLALTLLNIRDWHGTPQVLPCLKHLPSIASFFVTPSLYQQ